MNNLNLIISTLIIALFTSCDGCECGEVVIEGSIPEHSATYEKTVGNLDKLTCHLESITITFSEDVERFTFRAPNGCEFKYPAVWPGYIHSGNVFERVSSGKYSAENLPHGIVVDGRGFHSENCPLDEGEHAGAWKLIIEGGSSSELEYSAKFNYKS